MSLLDVFQTQRLKPQERFQSGLFFFKTGHPVFVLATTAECARNGPAKPYLLKDSSEIWDLIPDTRQSIDKLAHETVQAFFRSGGSSLTVLLLPIKPLAERSHPEVWAKDYWQQVLGSNQQLTSAQMPIDRQGFRAIKNYDAVGDLIAFPQAAMILDPEALKAFYFAVLIDIEKLDPWFLLVDPPPYSTPQEVSLWLKGFDSAAAATYFPWVSIEKIGFFPPSSVVAAQIQIADQAHTLADAPANYTVSSAVHPLHTVDAQRLAEAATNSDHRINVLRRLPNQDLTLWGCYTLSRGDLPSQLIHISRTLRSLRDAVMRMAEPFVFEPRTADTCQKLSLQLESFLKELQTRQILVPSASDGLAFEVNVSIENASQRSDEPITHINLAVSLEHADQRLGVHFQI